MLLNHNSELPILLGDIVSTQKHTNSFVIKTENGSLEVIDYSKNIVRVSVNFFKEKKYFSYSVSQKPSLNLSFDIQETDTDIFLSGEKFDIKVSKNKIAMLFLNKQKQTILQDFENFSNTILGTEITCFKKLHENEKFIGLGEKTGSFNRRGKCYTNKNSDTFAYSIEQDPLYSTIPFYIGIHNKLMYGIFLDNTYQTTFDFGTSTNLYHSFSCENGSMDYYFIYGENVDEIIEHYTWLTGRTPIPPLWALGFHQSRYSYYPEYSLLEIVQGFKNRKIPIDAIHLDIHYMEKFKAFTIDTENFSQPKKTIHKLLQQGIKIVPILDPGIKIENGYFPYDDGNEKNVFVKHIDEKKYEGEVWPGNCNFPDFTNEKVRTWWAELCSFYTNLEIEGLWNDMNEPAVWGQTFPNNTVFDYDGNLASFKKARNVYGLLMTQSTYYGLKKKHKNKRVFVLTRAAFSGIQKYSAKWTGDNIATDKHMLLGVRMVNSLGISGVGFVGVDIGGFVGNTKTDLYKRWIALGCFIPFFRCHKMINAKSSEPWTFGEESLHIATNFIKLRYRLIPYLYTHFYFMYKNGTPINKPMAMIEPFENWAYNTEFENQFLFGDSFLIAPCNSYSTFLKIFLPQGDWFVFYTDKIYSGNKEIVYETDLESIPLFIKSGKIICLQQSCENLSTISLPNNLEIHIYSNNCDAQTYYYEDDYTSDDYTEQKYLMLDMKYNFEENLLSINPQNNKLKSRFKTFQVFIHNSNFKNNNIKVNKKSVLLKNSKYQILKAIPDFDPFNKVSNSDKSVDVFCSEKINLNLF